MNCVGNEQEQLSILESLIRIPSPSGEEQGIGRFLESELAATGLEVTRQKVSSSRFNLLATTTCQPRVLLCTHMDTVEPYIPHSATDEVVRGRGACDAKGAMAAMISAAKKAIAEGVSELGLLFVVGEETDSIGAKKAAGLELASEFVILGEPTEGRLARGQKGTLVFRINVVGAEAHSACPEEGRSAVHLLTGILGDWLATEWGKDPVLGENTLNVGRLEGGVGANVIAGWASAEGIFRVGSNCAELKKKVLSYENENISVDILSSSEPMELHVPDGFQSIVAPFGSDAPYLSPLGRVLMLGPGSIRVAHSKEEQVEIRELIAARDQYVNLVKLLSGRER